MRRSLLYLASAVIGICTYVALYKRPFVVIPPTDPPETQQIARANNAFAWKIYRQMTATSRDSFTISPFSLFNAFALVYEGAHGKTAEQLNAMFSYPSCDTLGPGTQALLQRLYAQAAVEGYALSTANAAQMTLLLPRFCLESTYTLDNAQAQRLGMPLAFERAAGLSGPTREAYIKSSQKKASWTSLAATSVTLAHKPYKTAVQVPA